MAFRVVARVSSGAPVVKVYFDVIFLQQGRIQAGLVLTSALQPVGATDQAALAGVIASRIQRAVGSGVGAPGRQPDVRATACPGGTICPSAARW